MNIWTTAVTSDDETVSSSVNLIPIVLASLDCRHIVLSYFAIFIHDTVLNDSNERCILTRTGVTPTAETSIAKCINFPQQQNFILKIGTIIQMSSNYLHITVSLTLNTLTDNEV